MCGTVLSPALSSLNVRYGVSYISVEQAKKNLKREIPGFKLETVAEEGRRIWNEELGKIRFLEVRRTTVMCFIRLCTVV